MNPRKLLCLCLALALLLALPAYAAPDTGAAPAPEAAPTTEAAPVPAPDLAPAPVTAPDPAPVTEPDPAPAATQGPVTAPSPVTTQDPAIAPPSVTQEPAIVPPPAATQDPAIVPPPVTASDPVTAGGQTFTQADLDAAFEAGRTAGYEAGYQDALQAFQPQTMSEAGTGFDGTVVVPEEVPGAVNVQVPASGHIVVNPYGLEVSTPEGQSTDHVVSSPMQIANYGGTAVDVSAAAVGSFAPESDGQLVSYPEGVQGVKGLFLYFEFWNGGAAPWLGSWSGAANQLAVNTGAAQVMTLGPGTADAPAVGQFRAFGDTGLPQTGAWTTADTMNVTLTFTFTPAD